MNHKRLKFSIVGLVVGCVFLHPTVGSALAQLKPDTISKKQVMNAAETAIRTNTDAKTCSELLYNGNDKQALGYCIYWYYEAAQSGNEPEKIAARSYYNMTLENLMKRVQNNRLERY